MQQVNLDRPSLAFSSTPSSSHSIHDEYLARFQQAGLRLTQAERQEGYDTSLLDSAPRVPPPAAASVTSSLYSQIQPSTGRETPPNRVDSNNQYYSRPQEEINQHASQYSRPLSPVIEQATPPQSTSGGKAFHYPTRAVTTGSPAPAPVPIDNFAAPRSDSPYMAGSGGAHRRNRSSMSEVSSGGWHNGRTPVGAGMGAGAPGINTYRDDDQVSLGESRHRFTLGDTYEYNGNGQRASRRGVGASGWEKEGGRRSRNKKMLWCLVVLALIGAVVGVGVGLGTKNKSNVNAAATGQQSSSASSSATPSATSIPSISLLTAPSTTGVSIIATPSSSLPSVLLTQPGSSSRTVSAASATSSLASSSSSAPASSSTTPLTNNAAAVPGAGSTFTTDYRYAISGSTTTATLVYTIPTSLDTRYNGQWQFTQAIVLPDPANGGVITSSVRIRRPAIQATATARVKVKRAVEKNQRRWSLRALR